MTVNDSLDVSTKKTSLSSVTQRYYLRPCLSLSCNYYCQSKQAGVTLWPKKLLAEGFPLQLLLYCNSSSKNRRAKFLTENLFSLITVQWMWSRDKNTHRLPEQVMSLMPPDNRSLYVKQNSFGLFSSARIWRINIREGERETNIQTKR